MANRIDVMNVCRLCLGTDTLKCIFGNESGIPENIEEIIQVTCGVTITSSDNLSQMLCDNCFRIIVRMFQFRKSAIVNDHELRARAALLNPVMDKSVQSLLKTYPKIVLPSEATKYDIAPLVIVNKNEVITCMENYERKRKLEMILKDQMRLAEEKLLEIEERRKSVESENKIVPHVSHVEKIPQCDSQDQPAMSKNIAESNPDLTKPPIGLDYKQQLAAEETSPSHTTDLPCDAIGEPVISLPMPVTNESIKRKLPSNSNSQNAKKTKYEMNNIASDNSSDSLLTLKYSTKSLLICDICNKISYSEFDLKRHKKKHMRCSLCKKKFHSLEETKDHNDNHCEIKRIMNNLPMIYLKRFDQPKRDADGCRSAVQSSVNTDFSSSGNERAIPLNSNRQEELVQVVIVSDDEDENQLSETGADASSSGINKLTNSASFKKTTQNEKASISSLNRVNNDNNESREDNTKVTPVIKPNIEIIGKDVLGINMDDDDINILKNLLKKTKIKTYLTSTQTEMPSDKDIMHPIDEQKLCELKNLRKFLNFYKIPVNLSCASKPFVKYNFDTSPHMKTDRFWSRIHTTKNGIFQNKVCSSSTSSQLHAANDNSSKEKSIEIASTISSPSSLIQKSPNPTSNSIVPIVQVSCQGEISTNAVPTSASAKSSEAASNCSQIRKPENIEGTSLIKSKYSVTPTDSSQKPTIINYQHKFNFAKHMPNQKTMTLPTLSCQATEQNGHIVLNNNVDVRTTINIVNNIMPPRIPMMDSTQNSQLRAPVPTTNNITLSSTVDHTISPAPSNNRVISTNSMPPPKTTFVHQKSSMLKQYSGNSRIFSPSPTPHVNIDTQALSTTPTCTQAISITSTPSTLNGDTFFKPLIRVKDVSELK